MFCFIFVRIGQWRTCSATSAWNRGCTSDTAAVQTHSVTKEGLLKSKWSHAGLTACVWDDASTSNKRGPKISPKLSNQKLPVFYWLFHVHAVQMCSGHHGSPHFSNCKHAGWQIHFAWGGNRPVDCSKLEPGWILLLARPKIIVSSFLAPRDRGAELAECDIAPPNVVLE